MHMCVQMLMCIQVQQEYVCNTVCVCMTCGHTNNSKLCTSYSVGSNIHTHTHIHMYVYTHY